MYIGLYNYYKIHNNNMMLSQPNAGIGDNLNYPFVLLNQYLKEMGHKVATIDTDNIEKFDVIIFIECPKINNKYLKKLIKRNFKNLYLILLESPAIKPDNYNIKNHTYFKKIFTWSDDLIDNKKYFKINYSHNIAKEFNFPIRSEKKLCCLISSNKSVNHPKELYTERIKAIRWFEKNEPKDFDLYGLGWDYYNFNGTFWGIKIARLNRLKFLTKLLAPNYTSYKGAVNSKNITYKNYKFAICYENVKDFNGYITEKIFDCLLAGCIPIYLGAPNITQHIPADCFIDKRNFNNYQDLYDYIKNMSEKDYLKYLESIKNFLENKKAYLFSAEYFTDTLIKEIIL